MPRCSEVMTEDPTYCLPSDTVIRAAQLMRREDVGLIPVVNNGEGRQLIGVITDRDIVMRVVAENGNLSETAVQTVMSSDPITCHPSDELEAALDRMKQYQVRRIPIVDEGGGLVGIVSQADVALRIEQTEETGEVVAEISQPNGS